MLNFGRLLITDNKNYPKTKSGYVKIYTSTGEVGSILCFTILADYFADYDKQYQNSPAIFISFIFLVVKIFWFFFSEKKHNDIFLRFNLLFTNIYTYKYKFINQRNLLYQYLDLKDDFWKALDLSGLESGSQRFLLNRSLLLELHLPSDRLVAQP